MLQLQPSFHETWLFKLLLTAVAATLAYAAFRYEQRRHARQRSLLEQQVQARTLELNAANARLEKASQSDPLTGLRNLRYLANQLPADLAWYERDRKRSANGLSLGLVLVEIDGLHQLERNAGDQALLQAAQILGSLVRGSDYTVRWGDGFLLVLRPMPERSLPELGARIRDGLAAHGFGSAATTARRPTFSLGLAEYPLRGARQQGIGWEQMVELADAALRWVQQRGGDGWAMLRPTMLAELPQLLGDPSQGAVEGLLRAGHLQLQASPRSPAQADIPA
jgi:diguanylate cyclase (GGDEF)-like protein